jgi:succinate dehydrogenase / fumarate reductase cytochrome b subunit
MANEVVYMLPTNTVGRKILMAITGQVLVIFVIFHIAGNTTIFSGTLNAYAAGLSAQKAFVWAGRVILFVSFVIHIFYGTVLKLENYAAKPYGYAVSNYIQATFVGRIQIWTGALIAVFVIYHLLQFTFQVTNPSIAADTHPDTLGKPDVFMMVVRSFQHGSIAAAYIIALAALALHLTHGIQSSFQTCGLNNDRTLSVFETSGTLAAVILFLWYTAIPVAVVAGILK